MIFKEIANMESVGVICHYLHSTTKKDGKYHMGDLMKKVLVVRLRSGIYLFDLDGLEELQGASSQGKILRSAVKGQ
jgi:hypothetical protein